MSHSEFAHPDQAAVEVHAMTRGSFIMRGSKITPDGAFDKPLSKKQVLAKAGPLIK